MMGGNLDAASKGIVGIHIFGKEIYLLVVVSIRTFIHAFKIKTLNFF